MKLYESPYNFPDKKDLESFSFTGKTFPSRFAIGEKVKFKIGPNKIVDATIYAVRFEAATVWYDLLFDPYIGTPEEGDYTILTNVRSLMVHPQEFQERVKRISMKEAKGIKMKIYESLKKKKKLKEKNLRLYDYIDNPKLDINDVHQIANYIEDIIDSVNSAIKMDAGRILQILRHCAEDIK